MTAPLHQASCVAFEGRGLLIEGPPGSGKSSLALALMDRGASLVGDDGVALHTQDGQLFASPVPAIRGLLEIRNLGLVQVPVLDKARITLIIQLDHDAPRFIEKAESTAVLGLEVPVIRLWPDSPVLALRAQWAMNIHGLA